MRAVQTPTPHSLSSSHSQNKAPYQKLPSNLQSAIRASLTPSGPLIQRRGAIRIRASAIEEVLRSAPGSGNNGSSNGACPNT